MHRTTEEWEAHLGAQIRRARIDGGMTQEDLAANANVSIGTVRNLERGAGSSLTTLIAVARALGRTDWLEAFAPDRGVSPLDLARNASRPRQRVRRTTAGRHGVPAAPPGPPLPDARARDRDRNR